MVTLMSQNLSSKCNPERRMSMLGFCSAAQTLSHYKLLRQFFSLKSNILVLMRTEFGRSASVQLRILTHIYII